MLKWLKNLFSRTPDTPAPATKPSGKSAPSGKSSQADKPQASEKARPSGKSGSGHKSKGAGKQHASGKSTEAKKPVPASKPAATKAPKEKEEPLNPDEFIWCLVGNIVISETPESPESMDSPEEDTEESVHNQKQHFSAHTKVYCFPPKWNEGSQRCKVIGRHRKSKRHICVVMAAEQITNWRIEKVQKPYVVKMMQRQKGWSDSDADKEKIEAILAQLPNAQV